MRDGWPVAHQAFSPRPHGAARSLSIVDTGGVLLDSDVISPARERRRANLWMGLELLAVAIIVYGPTVVTVAIGRPMTWAIGLGALGGIVLVCMPLQAAECLGPAVRVTERNGDYLTGKTITGWRSVDLRQIAMLRCRNSPAPAQVPGRIMVTDTSGAMLGVRENDPDALEALRDALAQSRGRTIRISPQAALVLENRTVDDAPLGYVPAPCRDEGTLLRGVTYGLLHVAIYTAVCAVVFSDLNA